MKITLDDARALAKFATEFEIKLDIAASPPLWIAPAAQTTTKSPTFSDDEASVITSIRVEKEDWNWFKNDCAANGTTTCREIRAWIHSQRAAQNYPASIHRKPEYLR